MESRAFIRHANVLKVKIKDLAVNFGRPEEIKSTRDSLQKELNQLFAGLQNPTLPSAGKLCSAALAAGFTVKPEMQHRLQQAEGYWS